MKINTEHVFTSAHWEGTVQQTQAPQCSGWWAGGAMRPADRCYCWRQAIHFHSIFYVSTGRFNVASAKQRGRQARHMECWNTQKSGLHVRQRRMLQTCRSNTAGCRMIHAFSYHRLQRILRLLSTSECHIHMRVTGEKDQLRWWFIHPLTIRAGLFPMIYLLVLSLPHLKSPMQFTTLTAASSDALSEPHKFPYWHELRDITSIYFPAQIKLMIPCMV